MRRLAALVPDGLSAVQRALYDAILGGPRGPGFTGEDGHLVGPFNAMLHNPAIGSPLARLGEALRYEGLLPARGRELAILTVAAAYRSEFEWYAHAPIAEGLGIEAAVVAAIRSGRRPCLGDEAEQATVDVVRAVLGRADLDDAAYARAAALIGEPELVELTTLIGYYGILATQLRLFRVPLPPGVAAVFAGSARADGDNS